MQGLKTQGYENEGIGKCRDENAGNGIPEIKPQGWLPSVIKKPWWWQIFIVLLNINDKIREMISVTKKIATNGIGRDF